MNGDPEADVVPAGERYLRLATTLLQRMRVARPDGGIWEAADLQWWSRQERATDRDGQLFWTGGDGEPLAAVIRTKFGGVVQCDVLILSGSADDRRAVWRAALDRTEALGVPTEFPVSPDDSVGLAELAAAGYAPDGGPGVVSCWLPAEDRPAAGDLAAGYRLLSRADDPGRPHPMAARNGPQVAQRLLACSLYRPELDLMVAAPDGDVAGYGLFWADPVTGVGLVEPMRTEDAHQRRGIASYLLAAGLDRLARLGCQRLKVSNDISLYLRAGFRPLGAAAPVYVMTQAAPRAAVAAASPDQRSPRST